MRSLVVFSSESGNSYKVAKAFWEGLPGEKRLFSVQAPPDPADYDMVAVAFWLQGGQPDPKTQEFLPKIGDRPVFLMATHGAPAGSEHVSKAMDRAKELVPNSKILGTYTCQGQVGPVILERAKAKPQPPEWLAGAASAEGHPTAEELEAVKALAAKISL